MKLILVTFCVITTALAYENSDVKSARIESCRGCSLNRLPEVKKFVLDDAPNYDQIEVKFISGAPPELVLLDETDKELERIPLSQLTRVEYMIIELKTDEALVNERAASKANINIDLLSMKMAEWLH